MQPLDIPIWEALGTRQARFATGTGLARRFPHAVSPLAGLREDSAEALAALAALTGPGEPAGVFVHGSLPPAPGWTAATEAPLLQMVHSGGRIPEVGRDFVELGEADVPEMVALATLTKPGPFAARTRELGDYLGVREDGRLVAMAGERLRLPGYTEISAVCTHSDYLGRGLARARELYARFGFAERLHYKYAILRRNS